MLHFARRLISVFGLSALLLVGTVATPTLARADVLRVDTSEPRYAAIVVDANSGEVLYDVRADNPRYPASITKVMTMYMAFEALSEGRLKMSDRIVMSPRAAAQEPTKLGLRAGGTLSVDEALQALAVKSANDVAVAVAEKIGGTESRFGEMMTMKARELGMSKTRFTNASGLPDTRQVSTARDIAILSRAVMRDYPQYYRYFSQRQFTYGGRTMNSHNHLLNQMPGVDGIKTGFTRAAGFNLAASAVQDGRRLIAVVLGGSSRVARDDNVEDLLIEGFSLARSGGMGQRVMLTRNDTPAGYKIIRPPVEQGDADQGSMSIKLTNNPSGGAEYASLDTQLQPVPNPQTRTAQTVKTVRGAYAVQVGAFRNRSQAHTHLAMINRRYGTIIRDGDAEVGDLVRGYYRVRFSGMSQEDARNTCVALRAKSQPCIVTVN